MKTASMTTAELYIHLDTLIGADIPVFIQGSLGIEFLSYVKVYEKFPYDESFIIIAGHL
jgi:hypothetical protein